MPSNLNSMDFEVILKKLSKALDEKYLLAADFSEHDQYFTLDGSDIFDLYQSQDNIKLAIGSLADDVQELKKHLSDPQREFTLVDIDRVANILTIISKLNHDLV